MERCRRFLLGKSPPAALRAAQTIQRRFAQLQTSPEIGRPFPADPTFRELVIAFGDSGYVALYRYEPTLDAVYIVAFRHQKEAGY